MDIQEAKEIIEAAITNQGYTIEYTSGNYGSVSYKQKICRVPNAKTRSTLYVLCHEAAHVFDGQHKDRQFECEYRMEKKAHEYMRMFGFSVPRSQTQRAKRYVSYRLGMSKRRGLKAKVNSKIKAWIS